MSPAADQYDDFVATFRAMDDAKRARRAGREVAQEAPASAAMTWAEARGIAVRCLPYGWQYQRDGRVLCWWPRSGRVLLQGRDADRARARAVGTHDRGDIVARLAAAFPEARP